MPEEPMKSPSTQDLKQDNGLWQQTRKSLIERLGNWEDQRTWNEFYQTYWRLIYSVSSKAGLTREEAFDVIQETIVAIARQMQTGQYQSGKGSFKAWLLQMTRWRVMDVYRARKRQPSLADQGDAASEEWQTNAIDQLTQEKDNLLESIWDQEWQENITHAALEKLKETVSPRQFQIFDCCVIKGLGPQKTGEALGISTAQVYLCKHRVGSLFKKEVEALKKTMI
jgi:RNA polymerase sigma factor (sigma-70 family)